MCMRVCHNAHIFVMVVQGEVKAGREFLYSSQPSAYAMQPWETVNYADCHDGQSLFDQVNSQNP